MDQCRTVETAIVGIKFHQGAADKLNAALVGSHVTLVRQPDNPHDHNAIGCYVGDLLCGYIPRDRAAHLARDMDRGVTVYAVLKKHNRLNIRIEEAATT